MTTNRTNPQRQRLYQPRLPLPDVSAGRPVRTVAPPTTPKPKSTTKGDRRTAAGQAVRRRPSSPAPTAVPRSASPSEVGNWRLDEATRRAGRQGVAAARAALARAVPTGATRQATAA